VLVTVITIIASTAAVILLLNRGMRDGALRFSTEGYVMIIISAAILTVSIGLLAFSLLHRKVKSADRPEKEEPAKETITSSITEPKSPSERSAENDFKEEADEHLISRLLDGDERRLFQMIVSSGGEMLQMDIVAKRIFSKAKVTRLLDKLENRGLIVRERHGLTNKIRLKK